MFSYATKVLTALTGAALLGAAVYYAVVGGRAGAVLMLMLSLAAVLALVAVVAAGVVDVAPETPADAGPPEPNAHTPGPAATGSVWPIFSAGALTLLAVGAATNAVVVYAGVIAVGVAALGWLSKAWADHASWTPRVSSRVSERFVTPLLLPVCGTLAAAFVAINVSRVLLASSEKVAPLVSIALAIVLLLGLAFVAMRPRLTSGILTGAAVVAGVAILGAGFAGAAQGEREFHKEHKPEPVLIHAKNTNFVEKRVVATSTEDDKILIDFENDDEGVFHNVAVYESADASAKPIWNGAGFPGVKDMKYSFDAPDPGSYTFRCDFHANMVGTFVVEGG